MKNPSNPVNPVLPPKSEALPLADNFQLTCGGESGYGDGLEGVGL
jgi:hypothetical protein